MELNLDESIIHGFQRSQEQLCLQILYQGYLLMLAEAKYDLDWEEDTLTINYARNMRLTNEARENNVTIIDQRKIYIEEHYSGENSTRTAPIIDLQFTKWFQNDAEIHFYAEAKNLSEQNWNKKSGKSVNAVYYHNRYIETGIGNFLSGRYPSGCLVGYVVEGDTQKILSSINKLIVNNGLSPRVGVIEQEDPPLYPEMYFSTNQSTSGETLLRHFMLKL